MKTRLRAKTVITSAPRAFSAGTEATVRPDWAEEIAAANDQAPAFEAGSGEAGLIAVLTRPAQGAASR